MVLSRQQITACLMAGLMFFSPLWATQLSVPQAAAAELASEPALTTGQLPQTHLIAAEADPIELSYVPESAVFAALVQPARLLTSPEFEAAPIEVLQAALLNEVGVDPLDVSQILTVLSPPGPGVPEPFPAIVFRFSQDYSLEDLIPNERHNFEEDELNGRLLLRSHDRPQPCLYMPDDTTLIFATEDTLEAMLSQEAAPETRLVEMLAAAGNEHDAFAAIDIEALRPLIEALQEQAPPLPRPLAKLLDLPSLIDAAQVQLNLTGGRASTVELVAVDDASAEEAESIINTALDFGRDFFIAQMEAELAGTDDPIEQAMLAYSQRVSGVILESLQPERQGTSLSLTYQPGENGQATSAATVGILVALLLPAINAARAAAQRNGAMNQIRQIGLALMNIETSTGRYPSAGGSEEDRPGLSWRVYALPHLEQRALYEQFNLDEPWDSEHNMALIEQMPAIYRSPTSDTEPGYTHFQLIVGEGTAFNGGRGPRVRDLADGTSKTIMLVEADEPVIWTKPDDWEFDPEDPLHDLGNLHAGGVFLACFFDLHCRAISQYADPGVFEALVTPAGGERVIEDDLE